VLLKTGSHDLADTAFLGKGGAGDESAAEQGEEERSHFGKMSIFWHFVERGIRPGGITLKATNSNPNNLSPHA
jgi:hypothetical protein